MCNSDWEGGTDGLGYENVYLLPKRLEIQQTPNLKKTADVVLDVILCPFVLGQSP